MSDPTPSSPLAPEVSPLAEADSASLNLLIAERIDAVFNQPPLAKDEHGNYVLTDADLNIMVAYFQKERGRFLLESQAKEAAGPKTRRKPVPQSVTDALASNMDLL
jgi:hypothetical protein